MQITIGMSCFDDFNGVYFTVQSLRLHHEMACREDVEIIVLDNNPTSADGQATRDFMRWVPNGRYIAYESWQGTATRTLLLEQIARGRIVVCLDAHVLLQPGSLECLFTYFEKHPDSLDLIQGPMLYDDLRGMATHMDPVWRAQMWGIWGTDPRGLNPESEPFEIPMHGLGLFACRRDAWLGFNHAFQGFGGEEGYIHEKFRQAGRKTLCLPGMRWLHRFPRPAGVPFPALLHDKIRNYFIGHGELGLDLRPIRDHFSEFVSPEELETLEKEGGILLRNVPERPAPPLSLGHFQLTRHYLKESVAFRREARPQPCIQLGEPTGKTEQCPTCRGNVQVKLMQCKVHGQCTVVKQVEGAACCQMCPDYQPLTTMNNNPSLATS